MNNESMAWAPYARGVKERGPVTSLQSKICLTGGKYEQEKKPRNNS